MKAQRAAVYAAMTAGFSFLTELPLHADAERDPGPDPRQLPVPALHTAQPRLPAVAELRIQPDLPEVLRSASGVLLRAASDWPARREEMLRVLEYYALGRAPPAPAQVRGEVLEVRSLREQTVSYRRVRLHLGASDRLSFEIGLFLPAGPGPFPVVLAPLGTPPGAQALARQALGPGQGKGVDALLRVGPDSPPNLPPPAPPLVAEELAREQPALARGFALVVFDHNDFGEDTTLREPDGSWAFRRTRFFPEYPGYDWGLLRAWAWGVSRIVDYLQSAPGVDARGLVVTGFSRTGKSALIAGAFDERIAVTAPVASGGGGVGAFRFSGAGRGGKEGLDVMLRKYPNWFSPELRPFWGQSERLPFDQHWLLALIAPRGFLALEGLSDPVSLASAVRQSWLGAEPAYALLHAPERLGVHYAARAHAFTGEDWAALLDFAEQQLGRKSTTRRFDQFPREAFDSAQTAGRVALWNGRDLSGWTLYSKDGAIDSKSAIQARGGVLRLDSPVSGYLKTERTFANYHLHVEWRWPPESPVNANSGILVHVDGPDAIWPSAFECQLKNGNAGQVVGMGLDIPDAPLLNARKRAPRRAAPSERALGEWNSYDIFARGDSLSAFVNGVLQNQVRSLPRSAGRIALQLEGMPIELRELWLEPTP
ncbi:MAG: hypothetical protein RL033_2535 [Pseudomonadota bacterium]